MNVRDWRRTATLRRLSLVFALCIPAFLASCSVGEFLSAYFNTYYNASRLFGEAEEEIAAQKDLRKADTTFLPVYNLQAATKTKLTAVVEKCSKILYDNAESNLVDDALMMIGKSYYYLNELQKAERKFGELISGYEESGLVSEAELLLAQTYYRMNEKEKAREAAEVLADSTGGEEEGITARAFLLLGQMDYEGQDYIDARRSFAYAADFGETEENRAAAFTRVAEMNVSLNDPEAALEAYRRAEHESSYYISEYRAKMGQVSMHVRLSEYDHALVLLDDLRSNSNFKEFYADIDLETANTLKAGGQIEAAVDQYYLVDTSYVRTESSARSHFELGYLYETVLGNYDSALAVYGRGKNQAPQALVTQTIVRRADYLRKYKNFTTEIARLESLKTIILNPEEIVVDTVETVANDSLALLPDSLIATTKPPLPSIDSVNAGLAASKSHLAGLFYSGLEVRDSAMFWYERILKDHHSSAFVPKAIYTMAQISEERQAPREEIDSLYQILLREYPETAFAEEARRILGLPPVEKVSDVALGLYEEAEDLLGLDSATAAIAMFAMIVREHPASPVAPKAQFAIGWTYEEVVGQSDSALLNYKKLVQLYPTSTYATVAFVRLKDLPPEEVNRIQGGIPKEVPPVSGEKDNGGIIHEPEPILPDSADGNPERKGDE